MLRKGIDAKDNKQTSEGLNEKSAYELLKKLSGINIDVPSNLITKEDVLQIADIITRLDIALAAGAIDFGNAAECPCQSVCNCKKQCTNECNNQCTCNRACECQRQCPCQDVFDNMLDERVRPNDWVFVRAYAELASRIQKFSCE